MNGFSPTSRYATVEQEKLVLPCGRIIVHLKRRFIPPAEGFVEIQKHIIQDGDRLDRIAHQYLGDPEQFWRICDANTAMHPEALTAQDRVGRKLRITLPEGVQASPYAR